MWERSRVEELDSDDTDSQGVGLSSDYKRFTSDALQFTGIDMTATRVRKDYDLQDSEETSDSAESEFEGTDALQVALRDKEEALVQSALARIRRAQEKGKTQVKLNKAELDALERRRKRMQAAATTRKDSASSGGSETERKRRSDRNITIPLASQPNSRPSSRPSSRKRAKSTSKRPGDLTPPVMLVAGPDGLAYAPSGSYTPPVSGKHHSPARARASTNSGQLRGPPPAYFTYQQPRHVSDGPRPPSSSSNASRRPLPDDESWEPSSSRRSSASSTNYTLNPFDYQFANNAPPPIPQQYLQQQPGQSQPRRIISGPADLQYSNRRSMQQPPMTTGSGSYSTAARAPNSDPNIPRRRVESYDPRERSRGREEINLVSSDEEDEDDSSDDLGNGVQVYVDGREDRRERERTVVAPPSKKPVGGTAKRRGKR